MRLFVDASAIVSVLTREDDAFDLVGRLGSAGERLWSAIAVWETVVALCRIRQYDPRHAHADTRDFGREWGFTLVPIGEREDTVAFEAFRAYGKRSGHPARLNMGDCFAYACAKTNDARLLYKGDDFARTDLA